MKRKIENLKYKTEECSREKCIYVYVAPITFENDYNIYIYTFLARVREARFFMLDFIFERNEQDTISKDIYPLRKHLMPQLFC